MTIATLNTAAATASNEDGDVSVTKVGGVTRTEMNAILGGIKAKASSTDIGHMPAIVTIPMMIVTAMFLPLSAMILGHVADSPAHYSFNWGAIANPVNFAVIVAWVMSVIGLLVPELTMMKESVPAIIRKPLNAVYVAIMSINAIFMILFTVIVGPVWVVLAAVGLGLNNGVDFFEVSSMMFASFSVFVAVCAIWYARIK
jgi:hypothetical protein